jgi:hypothetical protein
MPTSKDNKDDSGALDSKNAKRATGGGGIGGGGGGEGDSEAEGPVTSFQSYAAEGDILAKQGDYRKSIEAYTKVFLFGDECKDANWIRISVV